MSSDMPNETRGFPLPSSRTPDGSNDQSTMQQSLLNGNLPQPPTHGGGQLPPNFTGVPALSPFGFPQNQGNMLHPSQVALSMMAAAANPVALGGNNNHMMLPPGVSPAPPGSPTFFHGWKLRSGKWLQEEESYADLLIDMFDQGHLSDCMTGSTLRAYLAQKLHCAPMRISKKFAGKGIGKKVYSSRVETRKVIPANVMEQRRKRQQAVEDAEKKFHEAVTCDAVGLAPSSVVTVTIIIFVFSLFMNLCFHAAGKQSGPSHGTRSGIHAIHFSGTVLGLAIHGRGTTVFFAAAAAATSAEWFLQHKPVHKCAC